MRFEERLVRDRAEEIISAGSRLGAAVADMIAELQSRHAIADLSAADDEALCDDIVAMIADSKHGTRLVGARYDEQVLYTAAAATAYAMRTETADLLLEQARADYIQTHWYDQLDDLNADDRITASA